MFLELVDTLRCLEPHAETWLVATVDRREGRSIVDGRLGCPECRAEYPVRGGVADFTRGAAIAHPAARVPPDEASVMRAAALLDLRSEGGVILLGGRWAGLAPALASTFGVRALVVNAAGTHRIDDAVSALLVAGSFPLAVGSLRGVMLDADTSAPPMVASARDALRAGGRLVVPVRVAIPDGASELARDAESWVAERATVPSRPVPLTRAR